MCCVGIGKTTLANEICVRWANGKFLDDLFNVVILIPLRAVQQQSLEEAIIEHIGEDAFYQLKKQLGGKCLLILEGLDEMAAERQQNDPILQAMLRKEKMVEVTILITSRPHACQAVNANRTIEVVGFTEEKIKQYVKNVFPNDTEAVDLFTQQLETHPHISALCYVPLSLKMILEIFQYKEMSLPSTLTELYHLFLVMTLQREQKKKIEKQLVPSAAASNVEKILHQILPDVPEEALHTIMLLSKLAYRAFFDWYSLREEKSKFHRKVQYKDPRIVFTEDDLIQSGISLPKNYDGFGLIKCTNIKYLTQQSNTYNFSHLSVQEFLCSLYIVITMSQKEQCQLMMEHFRDLPNIMLLLCGLTRLKSLDDLLFILSQLSSDDVLHANNDHVLVAVKCVAESQHIPSLTHAISPFKLILRLTSPYPYDCLCISYTICHYPIVVLDMSYCRIGDQGVVTLSQWCVKKITQLQELDLYDNDLTSVGIVHLERIIKSKLTC